MGREKNELRRQFSLSYIKLCMTKEVQKEFGPPLKEGNYCIYNDNFKEIYRVNDYPGGGVVYVDELPMPLKTTDLIRIPTAQEIQKHFGTEGDGYRSDFDDFCQNPRDRGYSFEELSQFPSQEEKWLLYCMRTTRKQGRLFKENKWILAKD